MIKLDRLVNDYQPQVKLDKTEVSQVMEKTSFDICTVHFEDYKE